MTTERTGQPRGLTRRSVLASGAGIVGASIVPSFMPRLASAAD
jgi:hypothetical protein